MQRHQIIALTLSVALLAGCRSAAAARSAGAGAARTDDGVQGTPVGDDRTAMEAAIDAGRLRYAAPAQTAQGGLALAPNAPDSYVVKRGDTLWGIAKVFLRDPWYWPEIWQVNPQIQNPHLIYPGDTLHLVYIEGRPSIVLQRGVWSAATAHGCVPRVRSQPLEAAVTTIPYETVAAFMSKPSVLDKEQIKTAPLRAGHARLARGHVRRQHGVCARLHQPGRARHALQRGARRRPAARSGRQPHPRLRRRVHRAPAT